MKNFLSHIGIKRRSGRYPWGSGKNPEQRGRSFLGYVKALKDEGMSETDIAKGMGMSILELRAKKSVARSELRDALRTQALKLEDKGLSRVAIGERMGMNESSVRALLDPVLHERAQVTAATANMLREQVSKKGIIDIGGGVETTIGISRTKLNTAVSLLKEEGYGVHYVDVQQLGTGKMTTIKVLAPPDMPYKEIYKQRDNIKTIQAYTENGGRSLLGLEPIQSVSSKRVFIKYAEDGGNLKDGVIDLRRGVDDISLGNAKYAQVRIGVDGDKYMKGMAIYSDDIPKGYDMVYNTNKKKGTPPEKVFKQMETDPDNPFGSIVRQKHYITKEGKNDPRAKQVLAMKEANIDPKEIAKRLGMKKEEVDKVVSVKALNIVNEEGDWSTWSNTISSQVLSKQRPELAKRQLDLDKASREAELKEIESLTNPVIKKRLLESFSDDLDSAAVHLKAAALPRQAQKVILPFPKMKENEVYAPDFRDGEKVVLIRHPHGGTFEIPELTVNNRNKEVKGLIGNALDAIGIHPNTAKRLSGADFDGDTVLVIPNNKKDIKTSPAIKELENFNPKEMYKLPDSAPKMKEETKQTEMGKVSNLITDMTIKGASVNEITRAVKHSMVVIDAEKHHLDYKRSALDNGIAELKKKYQGGATSGASTLISRAGSEKRVPERVAGALIGPISKKGRPTRVYIDPVTGKKLYQETGESFINKDGKLIRKTTKSTKMYEVDDAFKLSSGTKIEQVYAEYANSLKAMANKARKLLVRVKPLVYSTTAKEAYLSEVASLKAKLNMANKNRPLERQAQLLANKIVRAKKDANPHLKEKDLKKIKGQALEEARARIGAKKPDIVITDREWDAIQLGAISNSLLSSIINNTDLDALKIRALPRENYKMTDSKIAKAKAMEASGYTTSEIASALGVSVSTVQSTIN